MTRLDFCKSLIGIPLIGTLNTKENNYTQWAKGIVRNIRIMRHNVMARDWKPYKNGYYYSTLPEYYREILEKGLGRSDYATGCKLYYCVEYGKGKQQMFIGGMFNDSEWYQQFYISNLPDITKYNGT